jgi:hypothetical protein
MRVRGGGMRSLMCRRDLYSDAVSDEGGSIYGVRGNSGNWKIICNVMEEL